MSLALAVCLLATALLLGAWVAYPVVLGRLARRRPAGETAPSGNVPVSVVVATREDPATVVARVADLRRSSHPAALLEIVVAVDATATAPLAHYAAALGDGVRVVAGALPGGKALTLNAGVAAASGDVLVFADSRQRYAPDAIGRLAGFLAAAPGFGAVSGGYEATGGGEGAALLDRFWRYEVLIRRAESRVHSIVAVTGAIYAMRRALWVPLPAELICDDLFVPMQLVLRGHRVGFCEAAVATDDRRFTRAQEFRRKVRTLTGMLQFCAWMPAVLLPWRNPVWPQFVCHKLLRLATPYLALAAAVGGAAVLGRRAIVVALAGALLVALLLALGAIVRPARVRALLSNLGWALWLQAAPVVATYNAVRGRWNVWQR